MLPRPALINRKVFDARLLWKQFPTMLHNRNKQHVFELAYPNGTTPEGEIMVTQWPAQADYAASFRPVSSSTRPCFYNYMPAGRRMIDWHVNFADQNLFGYYGGGLFARDELQVCEHPILASVREAVASEGWAFTQKDDAPFPVLVMNAERKCVFDLAPHLDLGLPAGLYGNAFAGASREALNRCTKVLKSPTMSNIIAIAAPGYGKGAYTEGEISSILTTALTAFQAAATLSAEHVRNHNLPSDTEIVINTGWWGCGAFGGNRELMAMLQYLAASLAGVDQIVFHAGDDAGARQAKAAFDRGALLAEEHPDPAQLIEAIGRQGFRWGQSNGT